MSKAKVTASAAKAAWDAEPFGWIDDTEMLKAEHPLAVVARAVVVLQAVARGPAGEQDAGRVFDGLAEAIVGLARRREYDALGWLLYGLEEMAVAAEPHHRREEWPLSGSNTGVPEAFKAVEEV